MSVFTVPKGLSSAERGKGTQTPSPRPAPPPRLRSWLTRIPIVNDDIYRFAPMVIAILWNPDRLQIGMTDRHRWNTHVAAIGRCPQPVFASVAARTVPIGSRPIGSLSA
jgi:hypothetical protein